jgi:hypothetical protein
MGNIYDELKKLKLEASEWELANKAIQEKKV